MTKKLTTHTVLVPYSLFPDRFSQVRQTFLLQALPQQGSTSSGGLSVAPSMEVSLLNSALGFWGLRIR